MCQRGKEEAIMKDWELEVLNQKIDHIVDYWLEEIMQSKIIQRSPYLNMRPDVQVVGVWLLKKSLALLKMRLKKLLANEVNKGGHYGNQGEI